MDKNTVVLIIIGAVVAIVIISIVGYYIARFMKGSLKLELNQKSVSSRDQITGALTVKLKKLIYVDRLYVGLLGERQVRSHSHSSSGSSTSTKWVEFYRDEVDVIMDQELQPGFENRYDFSINAPSESHVMTGGQAIAKVAENMEDGIAKSIATGIGALASSTGMSGRKRWRVISRLEMKGVDLATSKKIHVSLKSI